MEIPLPCRRHSKWLPRAFGFRVYQITEMGFRAAPVWERSKIKGPYIDPKIGSLLLQRHPKKDPQFKDTVI